MDISDLLQQFNEATRSNDTHMHIIVGVTVLLCVTAGAAAMGGGSDGDGEATFAGAFLGLLSSVLITPVMVFTLLPVIGPDVNEARTQVMTEITDAANDHYGTDLTEPVVNEAFWASKPGGEVNPVHAEVTHDGERQMVNLVVDRDRGTLTVYQDSTELVPAK